MDDKELYQKYINGDNKAFELLINKYKTNLLFFINGFVNNLDNAEDIFQDVILYIVEHKETYDFNYSFKSYLYMIAKSRAINYINREQKIEELDINVRIESADLEEKVFSKIELGEVKELIKELPNDYQMVLFLTQVEGLSYEETARLMNIKISKVKNILFASRKKLIKLVKQNQTISSNRFNLIRIINNIKGNGIIVKNLFMRHFLIIVIVIVLMIGTVYGATEIYKEIKRKQRASITPTFISNVGNTENMNRVWCGTFNMVWNDFMDYLKVDKIEFEDGSSKLADELNKRSFTEDNLNESSYYKIQGPTTFELKEKIEKGIKEKFNEDSSVLQGINWSNSEEINDYTLYSMLKKEFNYLEPFQILKNGIRFNNSSEEVKAFGIDTVGNISAKKSVEILFYNNENDFAIKLKTKENDEVLLYKKNSLNDSFYELYNDLLNKKQEYHGDKEFVVGDSLVIPFIKINDVINYDEVCNRIIKKTASKYIGQALQTIEFELNNIGGTVKSEVIIRNITELGTDNFNPKKMIFNSNFVLFLKETDKEKPYFALKVDNDDILINVE
jgi:RNA polymerase sigma-70 factor (ECF subfamily)